MSFLKLDEKILTSSVWYGGDPREIVVWIYLLIKADRNAGRVDDTLPCIARNCNITIKECEDILNKFAAPDPYSRSTANEGRRININYNPQWGIDILNWAYYSKKDHTAAERKARQRAREKELNREQE